MKKAEKIKLNYQKSLRYSENIGKYLMLEECRSVYGIIYGTTINRETNTTINW